jgi:hypothetical protein
MVANTLMQLSMRYRGTLFHPDASTVRLDLCCNQRKDTYVIGRRYGRDPGKLAEYEGWKMTPSKQKIGRRLHTIDYIQQLSGHHYTTFDPSRG